MKYFLFILCAAFAAAVLYRITAAVFERLGWYRALKKICKENGGQIKKAHVFRSFFKVYPGYDIEMTVAGASYGIKFFPGYLKNKNLLLENESTAHLLKSAGTMGITRGRGLPVGTLLPNSISEVIGRRIKLDLTGGRPGYKNVLIFSPECKRIYYVKKTERAEAYNGDDVFGYKVFYKKDSLAAFLEKQ